MGGVWACASESLQQGTEWVGEDRGGDTEGLSSSPLVLSLDGQSSLHRYLRFRMRLCRPGLRSGVGVDPCEVGDGAWAPRQLLQAWGDPG